MTLDEILKNILNEEKVLRPKISGLKRGIWVDEGGTHNKGGHANRIKVNNFKQAYSSFLSDADSISITVEDNPDVKIKDGQSLKIPLSEINAIKTFILQNKELLNQLDKQEISFEDFKRNLTKYHD